jgi:starvation-inducible DNA-binding protein
MTYYPTRIDIPSVVQVEIIELLNQILATTLALKTQVKQIHWNVKGMQFYQLHQLFDEIATHMEEFIDLLAERIVALGGVAMGTVRIAATVSHLPEYPVGIVDGKEHIIALAERMAPYAKVVRVAIEQAIGLGDMDTAYLYTGISRQVDKYLWFIEAHLHGETNVLHADD